MCVAWSHLCKKVQYIIVYRDIGKSRRIYIKLLAWGHLDGEQIGRMRNFYVLLSFMLLELFPKSLLL